PLGQDGEVTGNGLPSAIFDAALNKESAFVNASGINAAVKNYPQTLLHEELRDRITRVTALAAVTPAIAPVLLRTREHCVNQGTGIAWVDTGNQGGSKVGRTPAGKNKISQAQIKGLILIE